MMRGVPIEVEDVRNLLENIQEFTDNVAEEGGIMEEIELRDKKQLREAAFLVEDAIDEYMIREEQKPPDPGCACEIIDFIKTMILRHQIKCKFNHLNSQFAVNKEIHCFSEQESRSRGNKKATTTLRNLLRAPLYRNDIVGFEAPKAKLIGWLLKEKEERTVICVVGMTGLGKTTLAKKVYDKKKVTRHFDDYCVWITVSQSYTVEELLRQLLSNIYRQSEYYYHHHPQDISEMDRQSLAIEVRNYLRQRRYAIFFDDVWNTNFWSEIEFALPDNMNGSRILITTLKMDVALCCERSSFVEIHEMQPLNLAQSFYLFNTKAFFDIGGRCPSNLRDVCLDMVIKCKGLPLAIVVIGRMLSTKDRNAFEWHKLSENIHSEMINNPILTVITQSYGLVYDDLSSYLKLCLLYCAIYPEDYEIKPKRLIRHWIAEGFIKHISGRTLEKIAEEHLQELIQKCLVQKSFVRFGGKVKGVCIHSLFLVLLRQKARDYSFCKFVIGHDRSLCGIIRRLSIATTSDDLLESIESSHVRSLLFFTKGELSESLVKGIPTKYKLLKVLDFENSRLLDVPENVGDLIHLKYLSFRNTHIESIPKSIGKLQNLETLDLRQTNANELPKEISKLGKLQHLLGDNMSLIRLKGGIGGMESLQTLRDVRIDEDGTDLITELGKLTQLRKLSLIDVREGQGIALCSTINEMQHLEKLYIEAESKDAAIDLSFVSFPTMLRKLRLQAKLNKLPEWIPKLENLVDLSMSYSQLTEVALESLQNLPCLSVLTLGDCSYEGLSLHFQDGGFQNLKELEIRWLSNLESIIIEKGALPSLKRLTFINIPNLKTASGIDYLENLDVLDNYLTPTEFDKIIAPLAKLIKEKVLDYEKRRY
ncbi:hypothetical protein TSUD_153110 [Trifolium subterraneum]|uniref:Uncharacterized protein n=1 Tax=Trifolium subterraneum TaxID=3900 RepID=A0A2Z6MCL9_TRISU|nr:hypothetical protein TSUD_153110 [Trifolium subterraneum]